MDQPLWLAPEVIQRKSYNHKADVYAFGIILWELITRQHPFDEFPFHQWAGKRYLYIYLLLSLSLYLYLF